MAEPCYLTVGQRILVKDRIQDLGELEITFVENGFGQPNVPRTLMAKSTTRANTTIYYVESDLAIPVFSNGDMVVHIESGVRGTVIAEGPVALKSTYLVRVIGYDQTHNGYVAEATKLTPAHNVNYIRKLSKLIRDKAASKVKFDAVYNSPWRTDMRGERKPIDLESREFFKPRTGTLKPLAKTNGGELKDLQETVAELNKANTRIEELEKELHDYQTAACLIANRGPNYFDGYSAVKILHRLTKMIPVRGLF